ncbi:hypothetical protein AB6A40_010041 [Gnathostoma spinigerum]|uniref:Uncharacterized protein n=1 Tax=Gnathostoma spinigerum TaxID=75299 RepID=A0ABD6F1Z6_9BILA
MSSSALYDDHIMCRSLDCFSKIRRQSPDVPAPPLRTIRSPYYIARRSLQQSCDHFHLSMILLFIIERTSNAINRCITFVVIVDARRLLPIHPSCAPPGVRPPAPPSSASVAIPL